MPNIFLHYELQKNGLPITGTLQLQTNGSNQKDNLLKLLKPLFLTVKKGGYEADLSAPFIIGTLDPKTKIAKSFAKDYSRNYDEPDHIYNAILAQAAKSLKNIDIAPWGEGTLTFKKDIEQSAEGTNYFDVLTEVAKKVNKEQNLYGFWACELSDSEIVFKSERTFVLTPTTDITYISAERV